jgi:hypothetical protein
MGARFLALTIKQDAVLEDVRQNGALSAPPEGTVMGYNAL